MNRVLGDGKVGGTIDEDRVERVLGMADEDEACTIGPVNEKPRP